MKKFGMVLAVIGLATLIQGWGMYISHKINVTQNLIMGIPSNLLTGITYLRTIQTGYILITIAVALMIFEQILERKK